MLHLRTRSLQQLVPPLTVPSVFPLQSQKRRVFRCPGVYQDFASLPVWTRVRGFPGTASTRSSSALTGSDLVVRSPLWDFRMANRALEAPYLLQFTVETTVENLGDFILPEFQALAQEFGLELPEDDLAALQQVSQETPFCQLRLPQPDAEPLLVQMIQRSGLLTKVVRLWGVSDTLEGLLEQLAAGFQPSGWKEDLQQFQADPVYRKLQRESLEERGREHRFCVKLQTYACGIQDVKERLRIIHSVCQTAKLFGKVDLKNPELVFDLTVAGALYGGVIKEWFFGRFIASNPQHWKRWPLNKRRMQGPTALPPNLAQVMCNLGGVKEGSYVMEPFLGSGSILLAAAGFGAVTLGSDFDYKLMLGQTKAGTAVVADNFRQFGLEGRELDAVIGDNSRPAWRPLPGGNWDAIVTDPPYGIRAGARQSGAAPQRIEKRLRRRRERLLAEATAVAGDGDGKEEEEERKAEEEDTGEEEEAEEDSQLPKLENPEHLANHCPQSQVYPVQYVVSDLLILAAKFLVPGGRLVYLLPTTLHWVDHSTLPQHPNLQLQSVCEQRYREWKRFCITMVRKEGAFVELSQEEKDRMVAPLVEDLKLGELEAEKRVERRRQEAQEALERRRMYASKQRKDSSSQGDRKRQKLGE